MICFLLQDAADGLEAARRVRTARGWWWGGGVEMKELGCFLCQSSTLT